MFLKQPRVQNKGNWQYLREDLNGVNNNFYFIPRIFMEKETKGISKKSFYEKINLLCSDVCSHDLVLYKCIFTNKEINSATCSAAEISGQGSKQTYTTSAATKNFRNSKPSAAATTSTSKEEMGYLK